MTNSRIFLLISWLTLLLSACGQRGPLYLPDETAPPAVPAPTSQPTAVPPDPLGTGFEDENKQDEEHPEDEQADGL